MHARSILTQVRMARGRLGLVRTGTRAGPYEGLDAGGRVAGTRLASTITTGRTIESTRSGLATCPSRSIQVRPYERVMHFGWIPHRCGAHLIRTCVREGAGQADVPEGAEAAGDPDGKETNAGDGDARTG